MLGLSMFQFVMMVVGTVFLLLWLIVFIIGENTPACSRH